MNVRNPGLLVAALALLSPAICGASAETDALNACARAFASSLASPGAAPPTFKVIYGGPRYAESVADYYVRAYSFDLHATDQKSGSPIARASCSTNIHGSVVELSSIPL
jgi:hypothetical protein